MLRGLRLCFFSAPNVLYILLSTVHDNIVLKHVKIFTAKSGHNKTVELSSSTTQPQTLHASLV